MMRRYVYTHTHKTISKNHFFWTHFWCLKKCKSGENLISKFLSEYNAFVIYNIWVTEIKIVSILQTWVMILADLLLMLKSNYFCLFYSRLVKESKYTTDNLQINTFI